MCQWGAGFNVSKGSYYSQCVSVPLPCNQRCKLSAGPATKPMLHHHALWLWETRTLMKCWLLQFALVVMSHHSSRRVTETQVTTSCHPVTNYCPDLQPCQVTPDQHDLRICRWGLSDVDQRATDWKQLQCLLTLLRKSTTPRIGWCI